MVQINAISSFLLITAASSTFGLPTPSNNHPNAAAGLSAPRSNQPQRLNLRSSTPPLPQGVQVDGQSSKMKRNNRNSRRNSNGSPITTKSFTGRKQTKERRRLGEDSIKSLEERDHSHGHSHEHIHIHEHDVSRRSPRIESKSRRRLSRPLVQLPLLHLFDRS